MVINKITEKEIRIVRGNKISCDRYWVHIEILNNDEWTIPYLVNKEKLSWYNPYNDIYPSEENMKSFLEKELKYINYLIENKYELVSYEKYEEIKDRYFHPIEYTPKIVYLD